MKYTALLTIIILTGCTQNQVAVNKYDFPPATSCLYLTSEYQCLVDLIDPKTPNSGEKCLLECALEETPPGTEGKTNGKFIMGGCWHRCRTLWTPEGYDQCIENYKVTQPSRPSFKKRIMRKDDPAINYCPKKS